MPFFLGAAIPELPMLLLAVVLSSASVATTWSNALRASPMPHLVARSIPITARSVPITALAPSGVDTLPLVAQAGLFGVTFASLGASTISIDRAYGVARQRWPSRWWYIWEVGAALLLGSIFMAAGRSHFTVPEAFAAIYPPPGTWGFWYLPGGADFHVAWTGAAELLGGAGLLTGGVLDALTLGGPLLAGSPPLRPYAARALLLLVSCVTPANFYMFSHGATMPGIVEGDLPIEWHAARFMAQVSVLSVLLTLSALDGPARGERQDQRSASPAGSAAPSAAAPPALRARRAREPLMRAAGQGGGEPGGKEGPGARREGGARG